jgi:hypothetical protein
MKNKLYSLSRACAAVLALGAAGAFLAPVGAQAQLVVWSATNFVDDVVGSYGAFVDFQGGENVSTSIVTPGEGGGNSQAWEVSFNPSQPNINFQTTGIPYPASGNTNIFLGAYTLSFDMQVTGNDISPASGLQLSIFENQANASGYAVFGANLLLPNTATNVFTANVGYQHYSIPLSSFKNSNITIASATSLSMGIGYVSYPAGLTAPTETIDIANLEITMKTNAPPPPPPVLGIAKAKPALRVFNQDSTHTYNQEGFSTMDVNQSWVGLASPANPVSYSLTVAPFPAVNGYQISVQFVENGTDGNPYGVYAGPNALVWNITANSAGFTTSVAWKTNAPNAGTQSTELSLTTTSTNGAGTWTLAFTSDTAGTVTAPDGTVGAFTIQDPTATSDFGNPMVVDFGVVPNSTAAYGAFVDFLNIGITNVADGNEYDDFTQDTSFNTTLWNSGFSLNNNPPSVIQVPPGNTNFWVTWTGASDGYGLETKASLIGGTNTWFSPGYYGNGMYTNSIPTLMGGTTNWVLIPGGTLPTTDGVPGDPVGSTAFFRLANPPPAQ